MPVASTTLRPLSSATRLLNAASRLRNMRARLDHRLDAVALDGLGVRDRRLPLGLLVVQMRELEAPGLVGRPEVLVDQRQAELFDIHGPARRLDGGHARKPTASRALPRRGCSSGASIGAGDDADGGDDQRDQQAHDEEPSPPSFSTVKSASASGNAIGSHLQRPAAA